MRVIGANLANEGPILNPNESVDLASMIAAYTINGAYQINLDGCSVYQQEDTEN